jgi:hypothetical protein
LEKEYIAGKLEHETLGGLPPRLRELDNNIWKVTGDTIDANAIPIEEAFVFYEHFPLHFYNLLNYARWYSGMHCPICGCESIMADITLTTIEYPFFRCLPGFEKPMHRFNGFTDTIFEHSRQWTVPLLSWVKGIAFYLNCVGGKEPTLKEMLGVMGVNNPGLFSRSQTAKNIVKVLKFARKTKVFGKQFRIETLGQLVRVLKWIFSFNAKVEFDLTRGTNLSFSSRKLAQGNSKRKA